MGLVFGILGIVASVLLAGLVLFAGGMSDNPSDNSGAGRNALLTLIAGLVISGVLIFSHFHPIGW